MSEEGKVGPGKPPVEHQFKPGESGNPAGRPKGSRNISTALREFMDQELEIVDPFSQSKKKMKVSDIIALKMIKKIVNDEDLAAAKEILDRLEGKAAQRIDFGGGEGESQTGIKLEIIHTNVKPQGDSSPAEKSGSENEGHSQ